MESVSRAKKETTEFKTNVKKDRPPNAKDAHPEYRWFSNPKTHIINPQLNDYFPRFISLPQANTRSNINAPPYFH